MPAVILLDQRRSRTSPDVVNSWLVEVNGDPGLRFLLPFERTAGDEVEALIAEAATLVSVSLRALQTSEWWLGIGVGEVTRPLPSSVRESHGSAFLLARQAIEEAKRRRTGDLCVRAQRGDPSDLEASLLLIKALYAERPRRAREIGRMRQAGLSQSQIAHQLGISVQSVSQQLRAAHWIEEQAGRSLVSRLAERLLR